MDLEGCASGARGRPPPGSQVWEHPGGALSPSATLGTKQGECELNAEQRRWTDEEREGHVREEGHVRGERLWGPQGPAPASALSLSEDVLEPQAG